MSLGRIAVFLLVIGTLDVLLHRYVWLRLVRDAQLPPPWARIVTVALVVLAILLIVAMPLGRMLPRAVMTPLAFVAFTWLGLLFLLVVLLAIGDIARLVQAVATPDPSRRYLLSRALAAGTSVVAAGIAGWGVKSALSDVAVRRVSVPMPKLPSSMAGFTVVQLTDVHIGPTLGHDWLARVVAKVNALAADVIVITGDLVDGSVEDLWALAMDGWEPCAFLFEFCRYHGWHVTSGSNDYGELDDAKAVVESARTIAADRMLAQARSAGAEFVVGSDVSIKVREVPCGFGGCKLDDLDVDVSWFGTGIRRIPNRAQAHTEVPPLMLSMMTLGHRRDTLIGADEDDANEVEIAAEEAQENALEADEGSE